MEKATRQELLEAGFQIVKASQQDLPGFKPYVEQYLRWLRLEPDKGEALTQRSALFTAAKCYLQVGMLTASCLHHVCMYIFTEVASDSWHAICETS